MLIKANGPKSNLNKFHKFQQITKQGKEMYNVMQTGKTVTTNIQYFVNKLCKVCMSTNQVSKF